jgi:hypothetical protein
MKIVEFLNPLKKKPLRDICLAALYYQQRYNQEQEVTVESLRNILKRARIPKAARLNLAASLAQSAPYVDVTGKKGNRFLWSITQSGQDYVRKLLNLPEADIELEHDISALKTIIDSISDADTSDYIDEAIKCISVGSLRAAIVFVWSGAVNKLKNTIIGHDRVEINSAAKKFDPKARVIKKVDDFAYFKESTLLLIALELGILDKNEKGILEEALNVRNKCGHPGKYRVGQKKVGSFIEDVTGILFK